MAQQPDEALGRNIRMADAEQIEGHCRKSSGKALAVSWLPGMADD
jgi:hypothetical protein